MRYLSVCSGIEAASVAWHPLGWEPVAFAEYEKFPSAVLAHHCPNVPNWGDITRFKEWPDANVDVLVGGTPCQSFSVAGLREGLADPRGNLCLTYLAIADRYRPEWILFENVPGILSSDGGRDFGAFLGGLGHLGYGWSYRVLDAQYVRIHGFGRAVPQRRRRVFVVGNLRDWRRAAAVLFERESLQGNTPPRREAGQRVAPTISARPSGGGGLGTDFDCDGGLLAFGGNNTSGSIEVATAVNAHGGPAGRLDFESETFAVVPIDMRQASRGATMTNNRAEGSSGGAPGTGIGEDGDPSPTIASSHIPAIAFAQNQRDELREMDVAGALAAEPGMKQQTYIAFSAKDHGGDATENVSPTLRAGGFTGSHANAGVMPAVAFQSSQSGVRLDDVHATLDSNNGSRRHNGIVTDWAVRRLTPVECERLQGFPDHYTNIPWRGKNGAPDGPRYKALGNSMAVNVMRWIGMRIQMVSEIADAQSLEAAE